ncbi:putative ribonuclease toxin of YeeF-YezG toxin-antitoxin module [Natronobacillus azotifigens]|uniref:T7SS effector LXG polymorphic toxin n=1 Tax=Natronobacillus azotifigens TaxID=472978 RepID=A0A9J6RFU2_9BACI|nr:T7SS effector LXG polymorphic toxin [Natronobacillus azotifigens]MCZ0704634.1 T7SS effector LXG polymorphic toxin [Natronobacillus azotifigens]
MKQLNAERLRDTMEARVKHYQGYREQFEKLRQSFEEIVGLDGFEGRGATAIKGFYRGQMDVIDAWYRLIDHQIAFFEGVSGTLSDFDLGGQTKVDTQFLHEDLAQREIQADEMVSDQQQTLEQIFSEIEDIMTLRPFSRDAFDRQMSDLHQKRVETMEAVEDIDTILTEEYASSLVEQKFMETLFDELLQATRQGDNVSTLYFDANAYHNSEVYKNIENAETYTAEYLAHKQEQAHARELQDRAWYEVLWDGTKTFVGEATGYYDSIRATTGVDPVTGVEYTAGQRIAYAGLAAAGFIPFVGWAGRAIKGGRGIYATTKGVKAVNTSLDIYKTANAFSAVQKVEMGIYGLAAANGFSEYITGTDIFGNELTAEQRSASLTQGVVASLPFAPSAVSQGTYISRQAMNKIKNMNLTGGSNNMIRSFAENQSGLQKWLGNRQVQPALAGHVPEVPMRVMDQRHINKKLDVVYSKRVGSGNVGKGTGKDIVTSNKGNKYDITPMPNHSTTTSVPNPNKGIPSGSVDILDKKTGQIKTRRYHDIEGRALRDVDFTNHGNPKLHPEWPHEHIFEWNKSGNFRRR